MHLKNRNYYEILHSILSVCFSYNARETTEKEEDKVYEPLYIYSKFWSLSYGTVEHKKLPTVHLKYDIYCHSITYSFDTVHYVLSFSHYLLVKT